MSSNEILLQAGFTAFEFKMLRNTFALNGDGERYKDRIFPVSLRCGVVHKKCALSYAVLTSTQGGVRGHLHASVAVFSKKHVPKRRAVSEMVLKGSSSVRARNCLPYGQPIATVAVNRRRCVRKTGLSRTERDI